MIDTLQLAALCQEMDPSKGSAKLTEGLRSLLPDMSLVLSRSGWHKQGGVVTADCQRVARRLDAWVEAESGGDLEGLLAYYADEGYLVTRISGTTHYFTAPVGERADQFIQLEIEELQEVVDHPLVDPNALPDDIEDLCDPVDCVRLEPKPVGAPRYRFRRIVPIDSLVESIDGTERSLASLKRFLDDWDQSTTEEPFCEHWVFALQEYKNREGDRCFRARPISTYCGEMPDFSSQKRLRGVELANTIHGYDRQVGYPFAWYFLLVGSRSNNHALAEAVLQDQMGAYDYLPARDLKILRNWAIHPYSV